MDVFALVATIGAAFSMVIAALAARKGPWQWRVMWAVVSAFSAIYVAGWGWLVLHPDTDRGAWSEAITPASMASFFVVWAGPPLLYILTTYFSQSGSE